MKKLFKNKKGFTLVELMVVVAILGILVAVAIPVYNNVTDKAAAETCNANIRILKSAAEQYKIVHNEYPDAIEDIVDNTYIQDAADFDCPSNPTDADFAYTMTEGTDGVAPTFECANHPAPAVGG